MKKKGAIVMRMECYLHNTRGQNVLQERTRVTRGRVQDLSVWRLGHHCHWLGGAGAAGPRRPADRRHRTMVTLCVVILGPWQLELETNLR